MTDDLPELGELVYFLAPAEFAGELLSYARCCVKTVARPTVPAAILYTTEAAAMIGAAAADDDTRTPVVAAPVPNGPPLDAVLSMLWTRGVVSVLIDPEVLTRDRVEPVAIGLLLPGVRRRDPTDD